MNDSIISYWREEHRTFRGVTVLVLAAFIWMQMYPVAAAAKDAIRENPVSAATTAPADFKVSKANSGGVTNADPQRVTMEELSKTLGGMQVSLKRHRDRIVKHKDRKGNLHITITGTKADVDLTSARAQISQLKRQLILQDQDVLTTFKHDDDHIKASHLPVVIQQRHDNAVATYEKNRDDFLKILDVLSQNRDLSTLLSQTEALLKRISDNLPGHAKFDPKNLPFRAADNKVRVPVSTQEELRRVLAGGIQEKLSFVALDTSERMKEISRAEVASIQNASKKGETYSILAEPIRVASLGGMSGLLASAAITPPGPEYLLSTEDVQITPAIQTLAAQLHHNPVEIYNWVHDNIEFLPTYASIQGSDMTLQAKQGNAFDTCSLLIALFRASNIPARYAYGTINVPIEPAKNWIGGVTDPNAVLQLLGQGGIPNLGLATGGKIVAIRMEHIWVEAFVDAYPSRGAKNHLLEAWMPMDPSFKQYQYDKGLNTQSQVSLNVNETVANIFSGAAKDTGSGWLSTPDMTSLGQAVTDYSTRFDQYASQNSSNGMPGQFYGVRSIVPMGGNTLPSGLPYKIVAVGAAISSLGVNQRGYLSISTTSDDSGGEDINYKISLPSLASKRFTLSYDPASSEDDQVVRSYLGGTATSIPAYSINLRPSLRLDGQIVASGASIVMGTLQNLTATYSLPNHSAYQATHRMQAGDFLALVTKDCKVSSAQFSVLKARALTVQSNINGGQYNNIQKDDLTGDFLHYAGLSYWAQRDLIDHISAKKENITKYDIANLGIFSWDMHVSLSYGVPRAAYAGGLATDVGASVISVASNDLSTTSAVQFVLGQGIVGSFLEGTHWQVALGHENTPLRGFSTIQILALAARQGQRIYQIDASNYSAVISSLQVSQQVLGDIKDAVNAGLAVTIPQQSVSIDGWVGTGYVMLDPATGSATYRVSGGTNGGGDSCQCFSLSPAQEAIAGLVLVAVGIPYPLAALIISSIISGVDTLGALCDIDNAKCLSQAQKDQIGSIVKGAFILGALVGVAAFLLKGGDSIGIVIALAFLLYAFILSYIAEGLAGFASATNEAAGKC